MMDIVGIRERPGHFDDAVDYFSETWGVDRQIYADSMTDCLSTKDPYPRWYIMLDDEEIIGCYGIVEHDFMADRDFCPWLCALFVEPDMRGQQLGGRLLAHAVCEAAKLGIEKLYLNTDHVGYYEKYGWNYIGDFPHQDGTDARVYCIVATDFL